MAEQNRADELKRLRNPGVLIRIDGSAEVFYIDDATLAKCRLLDEFQIRGKAHPELFVETAGNADELPIPKDDAEQEQPAGAGAAQQDRFMTGDELQRELNKSSLFRKTNLLNAFYCQNGPFIQGQDDRIQLTATAGKNHKPITRFPSF